MSTSSTLVLLPGLDGTDVFFRPLVAMLPQSIRSLVVSYPPSGPNGYGDLLSLVRRSVAKIPEFYVLGSSFSGPLAIMLAATEPQKVRGIILSATFLRSPRQKLNRFKFAAVGPVIWTLRSRQDPLRRAKAETWSRVSAHCLAARVRAILDVDVRDTLRTCAQPVLCVVFDQDEAVPRSSAEEILLHCPSTQLVTLPGDHLAMFADPSRLTHEIVRFIREGDSA